MAYLKLDNETNAEYPIGAVERNQRTPRILIFTEGTILGPERWWDWLNDKNYVPIGLSAAKTRTWESQGARIAYLTSRRRLADINAIRTILGRAQFSGQLLFYRGDHEQYRDIAEQVIPDILIEDDCRSIGGSWQMTITSVKDEVRRLIHAIVVQEFGGIDHLPDDLQALFSWSPPARLVDILKD
jgi:hypothetical protein